MSTSPPNNPTTAILLHFLSPVPYRDPQPSAQVTKRMLGQGAGESKSRVMARRGVPVGLPSLVIPKAPSIQIVPTLGSKVYK